MLDLPSLFVDLSKREAVEAFHAFLFCVPCRIAVTTATLDIVAINALVVVVVCKALQAKVLFGICTSIIDAKIASLANSFSTIATMPHVLAHHFGTAINTREFDKIRIRIHR